MSNTLITIQSNLRLNNQTSMYKLFRKRIVTNASARLAQNVPSSLPNPLSIFSSIRHKKTTIILIRNVITADGIRASLALKK